MLYSVSKKLLSFSKLYHRDCRNRWKYIKLPLILKLNQFYNNMKAFISSIMFIYVYLGEQDLDVINTVENFKLFRASVVMEMIISILVISENDIEISSFFMICDQNFQGIYYVFTMPAVMYYTPRPERGISVLIFNAQINLQLLIYVIMIGCK